MALACRVQDIGELFNKLRPLGMSNSDFLFAVVARQLQQIGCLFSEGEVNVMTEHRFTSFVESALSFIQLNRKGVRPVETSHQNLPMQPDVILACADGNYHAIGIRILEEALNDSGISCLSIYPSLPLEELLAAVVRHRPKVLGLSFSDRNQFVQLAAIRNFLDYRSSAEGPAMPKLICGGSAWDNAPGYVKSLVDLPWDPLNFRESIKLLRTVVHEAGWKSKLAG